MRPQGGRTFAGACAVFDPSGHRVARRSPAGHAGSTTKLAACSDEAVWELENTLADLSAESAGALSTTDLTLIVDGEGVIRDLSTGSEELVARELLRVGGAAWVDT